VKGMTRSVLVIRAKPGCRDRLVELFSRLQVLEKASRQEGFVSCEVQVPVDDDEHVLVTALWASPEAYQGWLDNPVREEMRPALDELAAADPEPRVYEIVEALALSQS
jgi:heme-degrading monooxygenase HmoA